MCICCGRESGWVKTTSLPAILFGTSARIVSCSNCGLGETLPLPKADLAYYQDDREYRDLFTARSDEYRCFSDNLLTVIDDLVDPRGKRLLDLGCGGGFLVEAAQARGYLAEGLEANASLVQWCKTRNLNVRYGDISNLRAEVANKYDVVILSSVLEHVLRPDTLLRDASELLRPNGLLLVSQASHDGLLPRVFPWGWYGWQPREHHWHFTPRSLTRLADRLGLNVVSLTRKSLHHPWFVEVNPLVFVGRNVAACVARIATILAREDSFNIILAAG